MYIASKHYPHHEPFPSLSDSVTVPAEDLVHEVVNEAMQSRVMQKGLSRAYPPGVS